MAQQQSHITCHLTMDVQLGSQKHCLISIIQHSDFKAFKFSGFFKRRHLFIEEKHYSSTITGKRHSSGIWSYIGIHVIKI